MKSLGKAIERLLSSYGYTGILENYRVLSLWKKIVGTEIASHTRPVKVDFGKLYVEVDSPVWRSELYLRKGEILRRIKEVVKGSEIKEIIFK